MTILLTGATGFLGSHLLKTLVSKGYKVVVLKRSTSDMWRLKGFEQTFKSYDIDRVPLQKAFEEQPIDTVIHTAWAGVASTDRDNWEVQIENFYFSKNLIDLSVEFGVKKLICLGSQAEYGYYNEKVGEDFLPSPIEAYGSVKLFTSHYLRNLAKKNHINWYWIRIFSIIGENENNSWLLSQVIDSLFANHSIELTEGEQYYDYMYVADFVSAIEKILSAKEENSGIYNLCTGTPIKIKELLCLIADKLNKDKQLLKFGAIPYRPNQNMFMVGKPQKFEKTFGNHNLQPLSITIDKIIKSHKQ